MNQKMWVAVGLSALALVVTGCGKGDLTDEDFAKAAADSGPTCDEAATWTADPETLDGATEAALYEVSTGHNGCYDELGFDVDTENRVGYRVEYTDTPTGADGRLMAVPSGKHFLQVTVLARAPRDKKNGLVAGQEIQLQGQSSSYGAVKDILFGGSDQGSSTFVIGLDDVLPFTASSDQDGGLTAVLVRIKHP